MQAPNHMRDDHDPTTALLDLLRRHAPELLPVCRYLILGPYLAEGLLGDLSRPPTVRELITLKRHVERHGGSLGRVLVRLLEASGKSPAVRVEIQLDRLLELDPSLWTHPSHVLDRPQPDAEELLEACRLRMADAEEEERERLEGVEQKLALAERLEDKARDRRRKRRGEGQKKGADRPGATG